MVSSKSLIATQLGKVVPVPFHDNANRFVMKWKLGVLLDKNKDNLDCKLLRFFLQGHLGANKNVALDVDKLLPITLERVEKIRSLSVIKKGRKEGGMACTCHYTSQTWSGYEVLQRRFLARIDDLRFFLGKIAEAMKAVSFIIEDDTML